ncbi:MULTISPECIES: hypothetical protein [unclassified Leeuwenhoekiella]|uniref:hypothetical protein n=1 Tax=unclassified Leeuwenhoekiella TaxID=2615029 RepID=UPI000C603265|nr:MULTISPECIES: hypothetical protein [unclassified Leeuwenhoekiella]MAW95369.1 hypothetical protein [Leeuwenhoekiella sp.]MBA81707.1 hypothetical protein [Leeuwenhoekiella sp.]|tara:strand:- start:12625 stop:13071 length:447 start_codon:yes stop_codon:yes gene_type:complete
MKPKYYILALLAVILLSSLKTTNETHPDHLIKGTWELESFYYYDNNEISDTLPTTDGYRQIKMYTTDKVMWTRYVPKDSVEWFGYGNYKVTDDMLIETLEYGSESMMKAIDTLRIFTFELQISENAYSQISIDEEGNRISSENYRRIE